MQAKTILFEGQDRCGKGTQINLLYKALAAQGIIVHIAHYSNPGIKDIEKCKTWSEEVYTGMFALSVFSNLKLDSWFIADRAHLGEWVYGKKYRNYDADFIWRLENDISIPPLTWFNDCVYLIVFTDSTENLMKRDDGLSHSSKPEDMDWERERFKDAYDRSAIKHKLYIDINGKSIQEIHEQIKNFLGV